MPPMLRLTSTFPAALEVGDQQIPIHVARLTKAELEDLDESWERLVVMPKGSVTVAAGATPEEQQAYVDAELARLRAWNKETNQLRYEFFEATISRYITIDDGLIQDGDTMVTKGEQLLRIFHGRRDVLRDLVGTVIKENHLSEVMRKNSNSPRASEPGSEPLIPTRGGDAQGPTAASAASSSSAASAPATDATTDESSGETPKIH